MIKALEMVGRIYHSGLLEIANKKSLGKQSSTLHSVAVSLLNLDADDIFTEAGSHQVGRDSHWQRLECGRLQGGNSQVLQGSEMPGRQALS